MQWLTPVISATQEAEIMRITVWSQPGQKASKIPPLKKQAGELHVVADSL
jgi:hypothetical protein